VETTTLEIIALLPDGRPILSYGTRGHDPALAGGLTSAVYSFTREIDLRKTAADGMKIDVPGGGKLILRRSVVMGREVLTSVIIRGISNEQILNLFSEFGRIVGEVIATNADWNEIAKGYFISLFARKAEIYLEALKLWRASTRMHPMVTVDFRDVVRRALSVLGKTITLSEPFLSAISSQYLTLGQDELTLLVAKELIVVTADQDLFLALNTKEDQWKIALEIAMELKTMKPQAMNDMQKVVDEVKVSFLETIGSSINDETAFFRLSERRETWNNEFINAVYNRMGKRSSVLLLAHPSLSESNGSKGLREMAADFISSFLADKGPCGTMIQLVANLKADATLVDLLRKFVDKCGSSFSETAACLFLRLVEPRDIRDALPSLAESEVLYKSFERSLLEIMSRQEPLTDSPECFEAKSKLYETIAQSYAEILDRILVDRDLFVEKAKIIRDYMFRVVIIYQIVGAINILAEYKWKTVDIHGHIPTYTDLLATGIENQIVKKEDGTLIVEGEEHSKAAMAQDSLLLRRLWGNWKTLSASILDKMAKTLSNEFHEPLKQFLQNYYQTSVENFKRFATYLRSVGSRVLPKIELQKPKADRKTYKPLLEDSEKLYGAIIAFEKRLTSFINASVEELTNSEGEKRAALAKQTLYTLDDREKEYVIEPEKALTSQIELSFEKVIKRTYSDIASVKEKIDLSLKTGPLFLKYFDGMLEAPLVAVSSYKLPLIEDFFEGGLPELLYAYSCVILGLGVPSALVQRGVAQLIGHKQMSSILKPLLKVKETNIAGLVSMHLSEYIRMSVENTFSFISRYVDERYLTSIDSERVTIGALPIEIVSEPANYIGKPIGIGWSRGEDKWMLRLVPPDQSEGKRSSVREWFGEQFSILLRNKYGNTFAVLKKAAALLGDDVRNKVEEGIQRSTGTLVSGVLKSSFTA
jgi:hypothetical protein